jgi:hypothetical protein
MEGIKYEDVQEFSLEFNFPIEFFKPVLGVAQKDFLIKALKESYL